MDQSRAEELVRRLAAAVRGARLYSPAHPLMQRGVDALSVVMLEALQAAATVVVGFVGDEVVVDAQRLTRGSPALVGLARGLREQGIEKITVSRGVTHDEVRGFILALGDRASPIPLGDRLTMRGVRSITFGKIVFEETNDDEPREDRQPDTQLCTMIVSIADVFDALRSNRPYRQGLATARIRAIMGEKDSPAFNQTLLKRFVNLMGLYPVGALVRLHTEELAVVTAEHPQIPSGRR